MQRQKPKVSVVIPIYKTEQFVKQCVQSVLTGTLCEIEVILVNDGSPNGAFDICEELANSDQRIVVINKQNQGVAAAVIDGIKKATGEYIGFVDSDDYVSETMFETLYNKAKQHDADIVQCGFSEVSKTETRRTFFSKTEQVFEQDIEKKILQPFFEQNASIAPFDNCRWNKIYKSEILKKITHKLSPDIAMGEDLFLNLEALAISKKAVVMQNELNYFYRYNESSATKSFGEKLVAKTIGMMDELEKTAKQNGRQGKALEDERKRHIAMLMHFCIESELETTQKIQTVRQLKSMIKDKRYILDFSKNQPFKGKVSYILIYLGFEGVVIRLVEVLKKK